MVRTRAPPIVAKGLVEAQAARKRMSVGRLRR
jgi:hypothetical protein